MDESLDEQELLNAINTGDSESMFSLFTNPLMAIRYRFTEQIPSHDPVLQHRPTIACVAAYVGALRCLRGLAEKGDKFTSSDHKSMSVMDFAILGNRFEIVVFLANAGLGFQSSMFIAAQYGRKEMLAFAVNHMKIDPYMCNSEKRTILHIAAMSGQLDTVKYICKELKNMDLNCRDSDGNTPLHLAIDNCKVRVVKYLLELSEIDKNPSNNLNQNLFHIAAKKQNSELLTSLLTATGISSADKVSFSFIKFLLF